MLVNSSSELEHLKSVLADPASPVDFDLLVKVTGHNFEFALEILQDFLVSVKVYIAESQAAIEHNNPVVLRNAAHKIKGASAQSAIKKMSYIAELLESQAKVKNLNNAMDLIREIEEFLGEVQRLFSNNEILISNESL